MTLIRSTRAVTDPAKPFASAGCGLPPPCGRRRAPEVAGRHRSNGGAGRRRERGHGQAAGGGSVDRRLATIASITEENGNVETQTHDPRGMPAQVVEASTSTAPRTTTTTWDPTWHEPHTVAAATVTTGFTYNGQGAPLTRTLTDNTTFTVPYATNGRTKTWNFGWNAAGQLLAVHGPRWVTGGTVDTTTFTYNAAGYVQTIANPLGQTTTVTAWDWRGAPLSMTDPNGVATTFSYDIRGRLLTATINPGGAASQYQFAYDAVGDLARVTLPAGASLTYTVDCLLYTSPSPRDRQKSRMPSSA